jgi:hypothetical protein
MSFNNWGTQIVSAVILQSVITCAAGSGPPIQNQEQRSCCH